MFNICYMFLFIGFLIFYPAQGQENVSRQTGQTMWQTDTLLNRFSRKCEWRTKRAERRFGRYEKKIQKNEGSNRYLAAWTNSALASLTYEYGVGRKALGMVGVFFDALYKQHTPESNAVL